jgi:transcriptional regulator of acetoin/glycerol metabolism
MVKEDRIKELRSIMPFLAGRLTLRDFTALALAMGADPDPRDYPPLVDLSQDLAGVIRSVGGNISEAARLLDVHPKTIYRRLRCAGLSPSEIRTSPS